jgi:hypothetical protein
MTWVCSIRGDLLEKHHCLMAAKKWKCLWDKTNLGSTSWCRPIPVQVQSTTEFYRPAALLNRLQSGLRRSSRPGPRWTNRSRRRSRALALAARKIRTAAAAAGRRGFWERPCVRRCGTPPPPRSHVDASGSAQLSWAPALLLLSDDHVSSVVSPQLMPIHWKLRNLRSKF